MSIGNQKYITYNFIIVLLFLISILFAFFLQLSIEALESIIGFFSIISFLFIFFSLKKYKIDLFNISTTFLTFLYLFNVGEPVSRFCDFMDPDYVDFISTRIYSMGKSNHINYSIYSFLLINALQIGLLFYYTKSYKKVRVKSVIWSVYDYRKCLYYGIFLLLIGLIPYYIMEKQYIEDSILYTYQSDEITSFAGTGFGLIGNLFHLGTIAILLGLSNKKKYFYSFLILLTAYQVIRMFITGDRSTSIMLIFVWILIKHHYVSSFSLKRSLFYIFFSYIALISLKAIEITRQESNSDYFEVISYASKDNIIVETIKEFGGNVWCGEMVYYSVPKYEFYKCGTTYPAAIIGQFLKILRIGNSVFEYSSFATFINKVAKRDRIINNVSQSMGGSFSGECYYNFGWLSIFLIPFFGFYLGKFSDYCLTKHYAFLYNALYLYIATNILWWVRQYFSSVAQTSILYCLLIWIMVKFSLHQSRNN